MAKKPMSRSLREFVPDFEKWPESWMGTEKDLEYGKKLLPIMEQFLGYLIDQDLSRKVLKDFVDHLWLLGGRIIKDVSIYEEYKKSPLKKLVEMVETGGRLPDGYESMSKTEIVSFKKMCGNFNEFLKKSPRGRARNAERTTKRNLRNM